MATAATVLATQQILVDIFVTHKTVETVENDKAPDAGNPDQPGTWKPGDDIYAPTQKGTDPSDATVKRRFWKNEAENPRRPDYTEDDYARMREGKPPQRFSEERQQFESMEASHEPVAKRDGGKEMVPKTRDEHAAVDPQRRVKGKTVEESYKGNQAPESTKIAEPDQKSQ